MSRQFAICLFVLTTSGTWLHAEEPQFARPVAVVVDRDQELAYVANHDNGHISTVDLNAQKIIRDQPVAVQLSDLVLRSRQQELFAADPENRELILVRFSREGVKELRRAHLPLEPDRLAVSSDGRFVCVSSPSDNAVYLLDLSVLTDKGLTGVVIPLEVPVREILPLPEGQFLAADRFGSRLYVIDPVSRSVISEHQLNGNHIQGLALATGGDYVLLSHQILSRLGRSDVEAIHWGMLIQNVVSRIPLSALLDPTADINRKRQLIRLGDVGDAAADPAGIIAAGEGFIVAAAGIDRLLLCEDIATHEQSVATGARPTRIARINERRVLVLNELSDSLQIVRPNSGEEAQWTTAATIGGPPAELTPEQRGERLFYSARLSHDRWFSCNSCHVDGHTSDLLADTMGDGSFGNPKRIPSLRGVSETGPWGWNGSFSSLEDQIKKSLVTTMHGGVEDDQTVNDLAAYVKTLSAPVPRKKANPRGRELFASLNCIRCHQPPTYTTPKTYDIGLTDEDGLQQFNPPSLLGVGTRRHYLHDARTNRLEDAIHHHTAEAEASRERFEKLTADDRRQLLEFLKSL